MHVFDFAQLNSVRTLPYVEEWHRRYAGAGLRVIGVQAPRFPFGAEPEPVAAGLRRLGVSFPTAIDAAHDVWRAYGCEGWPSLFLWGRGGVLRWYAFGEGEYRATEEAIQQELRAIDDAAELPPPMTPLASDRQARDRGDRADRGAVSGPGRAMDRWRTVPAFRSTTRQAAPAATVEGDGALELKLDGEALSIVAGSRRRALRAGRASPA